MSYVTKGGHPGTVKHNRCHPDFGFLVPLIGLNQVALVPENNKEIEFNHYQSVQSEVSDARSALVQSAGTNNPQSASVKLGKQYPVRALARNPPPITGSLQTGSAETLDGGPIDLTNICGWNAGNTPETKPITYTPNYNYLSSANPLEIDNAVAYQETSGDAVLQSGQVLVRGDELTFLLIKGGVGGQTTKSITIDFIPSETGTATVSPSSDFTIRIPSELNKTTWQELLANEMSPNGRVLNVQKTGGKVEITLEEDGSTEYDVKCTTIGINQAPDVTPMYMNPMQTNPGSNTFNPVGSGEIEFDAATTGNNDNTIDIDFINSRSNNVEIVSARVISYTSVSQGGGMGAGGGNFNPPDTAMIGGTDLEVTGPEEDLDSPILIETTGGSDTASFKFFQNGNEYTTTNGDWMIISLTFETQSSNPTTVEETYIVAPTN